MTSNPSALKLALVKCREKFLSNTLLSEAQVSQGPVKQILQALGWDTFDIDLVVPEYSVGKRRVDYALKANPSTIDIFLEIKAPGKADSDADQQLFEYAFHAGVPLAILTDGRTWSFYLPAGQGNYQERRLYKLDIVERDLDESCARLEKYLGYTRVKNGIVQKETLEEHNEKFKTARLNESIPRVWDSLLSIPDELLCEVLIEAVEREVGQRSLYAQVETFLKNVSKNSSPMSSRLIESKTESGTSLRNSTKHRDIGQVVSASLQRQSSQGIGYAFQREIWREFSTGADCYRALISELIGRYPEFPERFQKAKTIGKRAWIGRSKEELFPDRIDLQKKEIRDLGNGWLLGLNLSAQTDMPRRAEVACACVGLIFGQDLTAKFIK